MSEILLQAIVEKLESLEIALLKQGSSGNDEELKAAVKSIQSFFIKFNAVCDANNKKIHGLSKEIQALQETNNQVRHTHHFHKHVWISVSLFIISLLLAYGWVNCSNEKKSFEANDMKYRYWKANGNASLLRIIYHTDSLYNLNEEHFKNEVLQTERKIDEQEKVQRLEGEKRKMLEK
ncbi:MAG TPA: hypothetical protein VFT78_08050 [Hanamia sp.]|nr:hypothetical protein [Hanamia sp.]